MENSHRKAVLVLIFEGATLHLCYSNCLLHLWICVSLAYLTDEKSRYCWRPECKYCFLGQSVYLTCLLWGQLDSSNHSALVYTKQALILYSYCGRENYFGIVWRCVLDTAASWKEREWLVQKGNKRLARKLLSQNLLSTPSEKCYRIIWEFSKSFC